VARKGKFFELRGVRGKRVRKSNLGSTKTKETIFERIYGEREEISRSLRPRGLSFLQGKRKGKMSGIFDEKKINKKMSPG